MLSTRTKSLATALMVEARPRVVAALVRVFRDVDLAEDLYQEACLRAVDNWTRTGMPQDATGWLIRVGRNAGIDQMRKRSRIAGESAETVLEGLVPETDQETEVVREIDEASYKDDILRLMFMCCHDELSVTDQLALALKVVVGFSVPEIARAFVVSPEAMEQRITRAKKRAAGVATQLDIPSMGERAARLQAVSKMVYLLFNEGYSAAAGDDHIRAALCVEAIRLARLLLALFPGQAPVMGLLALCLLQHSRRDARADAEGNLLTLEEQDRSLWDREAIAEGLVLIEKALRQGQPDPFQLQAAIAAVHCSAPSAEATDWAEIDRLYAVLEVLEPSPVVTLNRAVAILKVEGPDAALKAIEPLSDSLKRYRPYHAARGSFLEALEQIGEARIAYEAALECPGSDAERAYLERKISTLRKKIN